MMIIEPSKAGLELRAGGPDDLDTLLPFARRTFDETFRALNDPEHFEAYLEAAFAPEKFAAELANPGSQFHLLYANGKLAGYLKLNQAGAQTDLNDPDSLEIERIYVASEFQGRGLGRVLMESAIALARRAGKRYLWLGVWQQNTPAIAFYGRMGFKPFATHTFLMGSDPQTDDLMRLEIK